MISDSADATLRAWLRGVNEARVDTVLALYAEDAVLMATFHPSLCARRQRGSPILNSWRNVAR